MAFAVSDRESLLWYIMQISVSGQRVPRSIEAPDQMTQLFVIQDPLFLTCNFFGGFRPGLDLFLVDA